MRLRGALLWEADGEPRRDEVLISDERPNGAGSRIVILDDGGQPRAASPQELPAGSLLVLQNDVSDRDVARIQGSGFDARRDSDAEALEFEARRGAIEAAEAELDEVIERLTRVLQQRHPQLFDRAGCLRRDEYARLMLERTGGRKTLTREEILALEHVWQLPADGPGPVDAS
jgi:hypothetical protein